MDNVTIIEIVPFEKTVIQVTEFRNTIIQKTPFDEVVIIVPGETAIGGFDYLFNFVIP